MVENNITFLVPPKIFDMSQSPILTHDVLSEGIFGNITLTLFVDILEKSSIMEHIQLTQSCSLEEIKDYMALFK